MIMYLQLLPNLSVWHIDSRSSGYYLVHEYVWDLVFNDDLIKRKKSAIAWPLGLRNLQEIHCNEWDRFPGNFYDIGELTPYLFAPSLDTLCVNKAKGDFDISPLVNHIKLKIRYIELDNCSVSVESVVNLIKGCRRLVTFRYQPTKD